MNIFKSLALGKIYLTQSITLDLKVLFLTSHQLFLDENSTKSERSILNMIDFPKNWQWKIPIAVKLFSK